MECINREFKLHLDIFVLNCTIQQFQKKTQTYANTRKKGRQRYNGISKLYLDYSVWFAEL